MAELDKVVVERLRKDGTRPLPKWVFAGRSLLLWGCLVLLHLMGSVAVAVVLFQTLNFDWELISHLRDSLLEFSLIVLPAVWMLLMIVVAILAYWNFRKTPRGYRFQWWTIFAANLAIPLVLGSILHAAGFSTYLEGVFRANIPSYDSLQVHRETLWMNPEHGLLMATISEVTPGQSMKVRDIRGKDWNVSILDTTWRGKLVPQVGLRLRLIGKIAGESLFSAQEARPWPGEGPGRGFPGRHRGESRFP